MHTSIHVYGHMAYSYIYIHIPGYLGIVPFFTLVNKRSRFEKLVRFGKRFGSRLVSGSDSGSGPNEK
jgi:hypothetical protein